MPVAAKYLADRDIESVARSTVFNNKPDALCVCGVRLSNVEEQLSYADGAVNGTTFKFDGIFENHVDTNRVKEFMDKVKSFRNS